MGLQALVLYGSACIPYQVKMILGNRQLFDEMLDFVKYVNGLSNVSVLPCHPPQQAAAALLSERGCVVIVIYIVRSSTIHSAIIDAHNR
jgi:hypothetical protein